MAQLAGNGQTYYTEYQLVGAYLVGDYLPHHGLCDDGL